MVRILSSGDIVSDDDPRAVRETARERSHASGDRATASPGPSTANTNPLRGHTSPVSLFDALNHKLLELGIPRIPVGSITVEPVVSVAICLSLLFFGWPGILLIGVMYLIGQLSRPDSRVGQALSRAVGGPGGDPPQQQPGTSGSGQRPQGQKDKKKHNFGGAGYRLGN